jgi:hypothetical protein
MRRLAAAFALACAAFGAPAALPVARSAPLGVTKGPDGCIALAFSPEVRTDHLGLCVGYLVDWTGASPTFTVSYVVYVTHDLGHTWLPVPGAGLVADDFASIGGLAFSPSFATDKTVFLQTETFDTGGVYVSTDLGVTWTLADDQATGRLDDFVAIPPVAVTGVPASLPSVISVSRADSDVISRTSGPVHATAVGSTDDDLEYVPAAGLMLARATDARESDGTRQRAVLYACDANVTCDTGRYTWARGELPERIWAAPDVATSNEVVVLTRGLDPARTLHAWVSRDRGAHFTANAPMNALLAAAAREGAVVTAGFAWRPGTPRTRYLRIVSDTPYGYANRTADVIYRSTDAGAKWQRLAYRACPYRGDRFVCSGSIPWEFGASYAAKRAADLSVLPDGRLIVVGELSGWDETTNTYEEYFGTFCSVDDGRHWTTSCTR